MKLRVLGIVSTIFVNLFTSGAAATLPSLHEMMMESTGIISCHLNPANPKEAIHATGFVLKLESSETDFALITANHVFSQMPNDTTQITFYRAKGGLAAVVNVV